MEVQLHYSALHMTQSHQLFRPQERHDLIPSISSISTAFVI